MGFFVSFSPGSPLPGDSPLSEPPTRDDDYFTLIVKSCSLLAEVEGAEFVLSGFGRPRWPVDVAYDLAAFLEAVPGLVLAITDSRPAAVDLYSQGIECVLEFHPAGDDVNIRCTSASGWEPSPATEVMARVDLLGMLRQFEHDVARGLAMIDSNIVRLDPVAEWATGADDAPG